MTDIPFDMNGDLHAGFGEAFFQRALRLVLRWTVRRAGHEPSVGESGGVV